MTKTDPGRVVLVRFPFTDLSSSKRRPALVISDEEYFELHGDVVLLALTGQEQTGKTVGLTFWKEAGLRKQTWIKPVIMTVAAEIITGGLGRIHQDDNRQVSRVVETMIAKKYWA